MTVCRTPDEIKAAAAAVAAKLAPASPETVKRVALILAPYLQGAAVSAPTSEPQSAAELHIGTAQC